jgi:hypothetical protein
MVDDAPASIYVNLKYERDRPAMADTCYRVAIELQEPGVYGIGGADEGEALSSLEEQLIAAAPALHYVGRVRNRGTWESVFYGAPGQRAALQLPDTGGHRMRVFADPDPDWGYYTDLLLPDAERRQWTDDRRMVTILSEQGDVLVTPRRVDHHAYFPTARARVAFVAQLVPDGFTLALATEELDREWPFGAQIQRSDAIELDHIHDVVMIVVDAAIAHGGRYERWECGVEK